MSNLLKDSYDTAEGIKGTKLTVTLVVLFVVFLIIGMSINYATSKLLNSPENGSSTPTNTRPEDSESFQNNMEGVITYTEPGFYPGEDISYYLADHSGKQLILLRAKDQKLEVSEGLFVKVYGTVTKTTGKEDVLEVERIVVRSK